MTSTRIALTIAGSDPSGGAGIQADLKTFAASGVYGASVICALTAQNTRAVTAIHIPPPEFLAQQIDAIFEDLAVNAVKIGMLGDAASVEVVADRLQRWRPRHVVIDPVMVSSSGQNLQSSETLGVFKEKLLPLATLLTPNLPEAARLTGRPAATTTDEVEVQARLIVTSGAQAVLLKGGHGTGDSSNDLLLANEFHRWYAAPRYKVRNTHGTGCTLSSAIAARLALGMPLDEAVQSAKDYVGAAIRTADQLEIGTGAGPLNHFHKWSGSGGA